MKRIVSEAKLEKCKFRLFSILLIYIDNFLIFTLKIDIAYREN